MRKFYKVYCIGREELAEEYASFEEALYEAKEQLKYWNVKTIIDELTSKRCIELDPVAFKFNSDGEESGQD